MQEEHEIYWTPRTIPPLEHSSIGNYRLEYIIIQTGCSIVYLGTDLRSGDKTVLKFIKRQKDREHRIQNETAIMTMIDHPNILKVLDKYEYRQFYCLVLPYAAGGSLHRIIESQYPNGLPEHTARVIFHQMLSAVKHLHGIGVMHRDIKLDNFLVAQWDLQNPIIQLADFGFAKQFAVGELGNEYLGTPEYASPEMYRHIPYDNSVEIWSLGVTLYAMLCGKYPFPKLQKLMINAILNGRLDMQNYIMRQISDDVKDLIQKMCRVRPETRITAEEALKHAWFCDGNKPTEIESEISKALNVGDDYDDDDDNYKY